jgi:hypothetical protein
MTPAAASALDSPRRFMPENARAMTELQTGCSWR